MIRSLVRSYRIIGSCSVNVERIASSVTAKRFFIPDRITKVSVLLENQARAVKRLKNVRQDFLAKMRGSSANAQEVIFQDDLLSLIYLAEKDDIAIVKKYLIRYHTQNKLMEGLFRFGPVVMRKLHSLKEAQAALDLWNNPELEGMFNNHTSVQVLLDLLFECGRYRDVAKVACKLLDERQHLSFISSNLAIVACYRLNTIESLKQAAKILDAKKSDTIGRCGLLDEQGSRNLQQSDRKLVRLVCMLCINQKHYNAAISLFDMERRKTAVMSIDKNIMALAFLRAGKRANALRIVQALGEPPAGREGKPASFTIYKDLFEELGSVVKASGSDDEKAQFETISKACQEKHLLSTVTIEEYLCRPPTTAVTDQRRTDISRIKEAEEVDEEPLADERAEVEVKPVVQQSAL